MNGFMPKTFVRYPLPRHRMEPIKLTFSTRFLEFTDGSAWEDRWYKWIMDLLAQDGVTVDDHDIEASFDAEAGEIHVDIWIRPRPVIPEVITIDLVKVRAEDVAERFDLPRPGIGNNNRRSFL